MIPLIERFLPDDRGACRCIEVAAVTIPVAFWLLVWWPGAIAVGVLAALVWLA